MKCISLGCLQLRFIEMVISSIIINYKLLLSEREGGKCRANAGKSEKVSLLVVLLPESNEHVRGSSSLAKLKLSPERSVIGRLFPRITLSE